VNNDEDIERQSDVATQQDLSHLGYWVGSTIDSSRRVNFEHMKQQREQMEEYVQERLTEHLGILDMTSPPFLGYGTFSSCNGTVSSGASLSESPRHGDPRDGTPRSGTPLGNIRKGKQAAPSKL
jgi:hypothetical protein